MKINSQFFSDSLKQTLVDNLSTLPIARHMKEKSVEKAAYWTALTDEALWEMMFSPTIQRAWMVLSDGYCPSCKNDVRMYGWKIDALSKPWKVSCPHCNEDFPKNDFYQYYQSGLDQKGFFQKDMADASLLFNTEHPDPSDPLHHFGVDDGDGYHHDEKRWRFIGAYLIYGQWKQLIVNGIKNLTEAYMMTQDSNYAHKAAVLLDRIADFYPDFDFALQGSAYERPHGSGYVSTRHDACEETRELAMAYDIIFDALPKDRALVDFLSKKAGETGSDNPKTDFSTIQKNIEKGILEDALKHPERIHNNYPRTEVALILIKTILQRESYQQEIDSMTDEIIQKATAIDGVTGEKGIASYASYVIHGIAILLAQMDRLDKQFLERMIKKHPGLLHTYRFHMDTFCLNRYYPRIGDTGSFGQPENRYMGLPLNQQPSLSPSMHMLLYRFYEVTKDPRYLQTLYMENGFKADGLPYGLFVPNHQAIQNMIEQIVKKHGKFPELESINLQNWHLLLLRSGGKEHKRVLWMDYDSGGKHAHADGLNIGLFAYGLDLLPDFGYPPVQYGGWYSSKANWYKSSAAHNTVVVDGKNHKTGSEPIAGKTIFWKICPQVAAVSVDGAAMTECNRFERTLVMIEVSDHQSYIVDQFFVQGGKQHIKYIGSGMGTIDTYGLNLTPIPGPKDDRQMTQFAQDNPATNWYVDFAVQDNHNAINQRDIHLRYRDFTKNATVQTAYAWVVTSSTGSGISKETWIPRVCINRESIDESLTSTFTGLLEPYENKPFVASVDHLSVVDLENNNTLDHETVALHIRFTDQDFEDLVVIGDPLSQQKVFIPSWNITIASCCSVLRKTIAKGEQKERIDWLMDINK